MTQHRDLSYGERLPESWLDKIQELLGTYASPNMAITLANTTTVQIVAGTVNNQVGLAIQGRWRYITSTVQAAHPGGSAGEYDVYACASDNSFTPGSPETDNTVYAFTLQVKASGQNPSTALYRKIATCTWSGTAITAVTPLITVPTTPLGTNSIVTAMIQDDAVTQAKIAPDAVGATELANNAVDTAALQDDAVTQAKIGANAVGATELANDAVDTAALQDDSVTQAKIGPNAVGATELADNAVDTNALQTDAVTNAKMANLSVGTPELIDDSVTQPKIGPGAVGGTELADAGIVVAKFAASLRPSQGAADASETLRAIGAGAGQVLAGNDARLLGLLADPVTALPGTPQDKQFCLVTDNVAAPNYYWLLRYNATAGKWIFCGGSPKRILTNASTTDGQDASDATWVASQSTFPFAGDYELVATGVLSITDGTNAPVARLSLYTAGSFRLAVTGPWQTNAYESFYLGYKAAAVGLGASFHLATREPGRVAGVAQFQQVDFQLTPRAVS